MLRGQWKGGEWHGREGLFYTPKRYWTPGDASKQIVALHFSFTSLFFPSWNKQPVDRVFSSFVNIWIYLWQSRRAFKKRKASRETNEHLFPSKQPVKWIFSLCCWLKPEILCRCALIATPKIDKLTFPATLRASVSCIVYSCIRSQWRKTSRTTCFRCHRDV